MNSTADPGSDPDPEPWAPALPPWLVGVGGDVPTTDCWLSIYDAETGFPEPGDPRARKGEDTRDAVGTVIQRAVWQLLERYAGDEDVAGPLLSCVAIGHKGPPLRLGKQG